jgi:HD-GYP domain-containing protein (c-di-GMP phosphodiesterase class II)
MRLLPLSAAKAGMRLGKAIFSEEGRTLVGHNVELSQAMINKLIRLGYQQIYIADKRTDDIRIDNILREETRSLIRDQLLHLFQMLQISKPMTIGDRNTVSRKAHQCIGMLMDDLRSQAKPSHDTIMLMFMDRSTFSIVEHFYQNALNVCVYAVRIGMIEGYSYSDLEALGLGAMFHDIGNTQISQALLTKNTKLSHQEYEEVKKHTSHGFNILRKIPAMPLLSAHCALQHHEKVNGSGYPSALAETKIHPFAQWVGLLDAYDAMTNPRPYRPSLPPDHALENLFTGAGTLYDKSKVEFFRNKVAIYPLGLSVRLSTGQSGIVSKINPSFKQRPVVRVLTNERGEQLRHPEEIDLSRHLHIMIYRIGEDALVH